MILILCLLIYYNISNIINFNFYHLFYIYFIIIIIYFNIIISEKFTKCLNSL